MPEKTALAKHLREARILLRKSQVDFAAECGLSTETISQIEREKENPSLSTLQKIAAYLGKSVSELLDTEQ
ncbi:MAG: helix-turn-helix transcriptional regulator [Clostridia bacterium]|nr:helix-turn-helix transcriptional regulator [Clostridia bacterium]